MDCSCDNGAGEGAASLMRSMMRATSPAPLSQEQSIARLAQWGLIPARVKPYQGITGAQLVTVLAGVRESRGPIARRIPVDFRPEPAHPRVPDIARASAEANATGATSSENPVQPEATDPALEPIAAADSSPAQAAPRVWVRGTPLTKPKNQSEGSTP